MIAADTSTISAYLKGESGKDVDLLDRALAENQVLLPPIVLTEVLSAPGITVAVSKLILRLPVLDIDPKYWTRVAATRRALLQIGKKSRLGDACIAQSCIDHNVPLLTRDKDFRHYHELKFLGL